MRPVNALAFFLSCVSLVPVASAGAADTAPPVVSVTAPANGTHVRGTVTVRASASDNVRVVGVSFLLDGASLGSEDTSSPYSVSWNTSSASNAAHALSAIARDAAGNRSTAATVSVTVDNQAPTGTVLINNGDVATDVTAVTLTLSAVDNSGSVSMMRFSNSSGGDTFSVPESYAATKSWTLTSNRGTNRVYARFADAAGNWSSSSRDTIIFDTGPPTVALTAPAGGATLRATFTISASASDDLKVAGVQFLLDGIKLGSEDTSSPYSMNWNTTGAAPGAHTLSATARDTAGRTASAPGVNVTVDNQAPTGSVVIDNGSVATNSTAVTLTLAAVAHSGAVSQMRFSNTSIQSSFSTPEPYAATKAWALSSDTGTKTVYAQFKDQAGNWSGSFTDTIVLDTSAPSISSATATPNASGNAATITWSTSEPASSQVEYGTTTTYGSVTALDGTLVTAHSVGVSGLVPQTLYNYRVRSADAARNPAVSGNNTFRTPDSDATLPDRSSPAAIANLTVTGCDATSCTLSWTAPGDDGNEGTATSYDLRYGTTAIDEANWEEQTQAPGEPGPAAAGTTQAFVVPSLALTTTYFFAIKTTDAAGNVSDPSNSPSRTTSAAFTFAVYGDNRAGSNCSDNGDHVNIVNRIALRSPSFVVNVGDMITGYDHTTNWITNGTCTTPGQIGSLKDMIAPLADRTPPPGLPTSYFPVIGNHDDNWGSGWYPDPYLKGVCDAFAPSLVRQLVPNHTRQPYFRDTTGRNHKIYTDDEFYDGLCSTTSRDVYSAFFYYSFDFNNSHFVVMRINSDYFDLRAGNSPCNAAAEGNYDTCYNIHQLHWLQYDLARAKANPNIKHIFAFLHAPMFTSGEDHPASASWSAIAQEFSKVNADMVFSGHNHLYERTVPIYSTSANPGGVRDDAQGTVYVVTGGAGSPLTGFRTLAAWFDVTRESVKHHVEVTVTGDKVSVKVVDINGKVIDSFTF